jgi:hypothetical protein
LAIVGHFESLAEAQKLVRSELLAGVVQETYEEGQMLKMLPVTTINAKSLLYNRESTLPSAAFYDIHEQIPWTADVDYSTQVEVALKIVARQDVLDNFMMKTYKTPNDYRSVILSQLRKGCMRTLEDKILYGNVDTDAAEFDGIGHLLPADVAGAETWAAANPQVYDMGGGTTAVTMIRLRELIDAVRPRPNILMMTRTMRNTISATAFEKGIVLANTGRSATITMGADEFGRRVDYFDGVPIMISDYMLPLTDNTVNKSGSTAALTAIWAIRFGSIQDGGLSMVTGGDTGGVDFFKMTELSELENFDAGGIRLVAYMALAAGSTKCLAVIHSIDEDQPMIG